MELLIIILLILLNGLFSMAEMAVVSVRKHILKRKAQDNDIKAATALELSQNPNRFLSTTQIGITLVGIVAGVFGGATLEKQLSTFLKNLSLLAPYSDFLSITLVILFITYLSLIIGELVPKRIALSNPEKIAMFVARPMDILSKISIPIITLMSISTEFILRILRIKPKEDTTVSEEEVKMLIKEGTEGGVFELAEKNIVERTFRLSDRKANSLMTPRKQIVWLEKDSSFETIKNKISKTPRSFYPVCKKTLDNVIGIIRTEQFISNYLRDEKASFDKILHKPLIVPSHTPAFRVLELFKKTGIHLAIIVDEYGMVEGVISVGDILEAIVGDLPEVFEQEEKEIIKRDKKTWFIDGLLAIDEFKDHFQIKKLPGEQAGEFHTIGGYVMHKLGKVPKTGDTFTIENYLFEVVDMDGNRVDKIILTKKTD